ncbi:PREDICTED: geraniol 8-hydroxylase-like [Prunus mume]|uniref:Geraniol 8-hydroxylase-like n=1 Tax=Prunus mume TaxID=102107 RepID=A0ABM0NB04_PRUMU|nr:PREDICTED: geraniol 8-hydroxylase-like [Prunus mume]
MDFLSFCMVLLTSLFFVFLFSIQALRSKANPKRHLLPPGPKPLPFIGNLLELGNKPHLDFKEKRNLSHIYGPIITLQLGQVTTVVVSSSNTAKQVLQTHDQFLSNRTLPDAIQASDLRGDSLPWIPTSSKWRSLRKICNSHLFAPKILDANQPNRRMKVQELISDVNESLVKGEAVDIGRAAFKTTLNLLSRTIFSVDLADASSEMAREFKETVWGSMEEAGKPNWADFFPVLRKIDPQGIRRRMIKHVQKIEQVFDRIISQRLESRKAHDYLTTNDILDTLLNISEVNSEDMDMTKLQHLLLILFTAGTDTTSATLEWAMAELLRNPEKMSKAQQELDKIIGKGKPVEEGDIARLPYFQAIIKETFRLHPATPLLLPRKADSDVEICGYIVPKGAQVFVNAWAIGRDPSIWDNPSSFVPERFLGLDDQIDVTGKNFELIPFGAGRRICPGLSWTMRILPLMLGSLINSFEWKLEDGVLPETLNMEEKFGLTLQMAHPLRAVPKSFCEI